MNSNRQNNTLQDTSDEEGAEYRIAPIVVDGVECDGVSIWYDGDAYLGTVVSSYRLAEG